VCNLCLLHSTPCVKRSRLSLSPPSLECNSSPPLAAAVQAHLLVVGHLAAAVVLGVTGVTVLVYFFPRETETDFTPETRQHTNTHTSHGSRALQSSRFYKHPGQNLFTKRQLIQTIYTTSISTPTTTVIDVRLPLSTHAEPRALNVLRTGSA